MLMKFLLIAALCSTSYIFCSDGKHKGKDLDYKEDFYTAAIQDLKDANNLAEKKAVVQKKPDLLHQACIYGREEDISILIDAGYSVNTCDKSGYSPLHYAAAHDYKQASLLLVKTLLSYEADPNNPNNLPLQAALHRGYKCVAKALLEKGAQPTKTQIMELQKKWPDLISVIQPKPAN